MAGGQPTPPERFEPSVPREKDGEKSIAVLPLSRSRYPWVGWAQNKGAGAIQSGARLLGQSIGAAMVALVFGISMGGRGAITALVLAACFAAVATGVSMTRQSDFMRAGRQEREPDATKPAASPGPAA